GSEKHPIMGCYGIGVGRTMAAIIEESADNNGPIWNMATAPFAIEVIGLSDKDDYVSKMTEQIYIAIKSAGIDVLIDNRAVRAGEKFADADLIAAPIRLIVSSKNLANNIIEVKYRVNDIDTSEYKTAFGLDTYLSEIMETISKMSGK
ncbi:MAG: His/Gly/Thr/Pro-type tRNA ligase C-terminal domain-containing protein, partial [Alphaproteobacteria bacterium]